MSFDYEAYLAQLVAVTDHEAARALAIALHDAFDSPAGTFHELNCYTCTEWSDDDTPRRDPKPTDDCWQIAAEILRRQHGAIRP